MKTKWLILSIAIFAIILIPSLCNAQQKGNASDPNQSHKIDSKNETNGDSQVYAYVDEKPEPEGGMTALYKFLADKIIYPKKAKDKGVQGIVYVSFIVEKDGKLSDVKIMRDMGGFGLGEEAVRVIKLMPPWKPAKINGKAVRATYNVPVKFVLH